MSTASSHQVSHSDPAYQAFVARMQRRFEENLAKHKYLFTTDVDAWSIYLDGFAHPDVRQYNNCHCCKEFMRKYGNLVCIQEDGTLVPALWFDEDAEGTPMQWAVLHVIEALVKAKVTGVFYTTEKHWGKAQSGGWDHLAISVPVGWVQRKSLIDTAYQQMAKKKEDFKNLKVARSEFARELVGLVVDVLKTDTLYRNDKLLGPAEFFQSLYGLRDSQVWLKVAGAPDGFCHPKSSMFGTLLDDFKAGMSFDVVKKRFEAKMHPLQYQRPQAAPTSAAIKRAEEIAEKMNLAPALERRVARVDECCLLWSPAKEERQGGSVFGHLKPKSGATTICTTSKKMTWVRFAEEVLPTAKSIEVQVSPYRQPWYVFTTAVNPGAIPIYQWDSESDRNPVAWYTYMGGSYCNHFGVAAGWHKVSGVSRFPNTWTSPAEEKRAIFFIEGARETKGKSVCLFPECLRQELREVRSVIEAYSNSQGLQGLSDGSAVGISVGDNSTLTVRVAGERITTVFEIDRWN